MPSFKKLVLTAPVIHRKHNGESVECHHIDCDVQLKAGDLAYRHLAKGGTVYYCPTCYEKLWL